MVTPQNLTVWLKDQSLLLVLVFVALLVVVLLLRVSAKRREEALLREREGITEHTFTAHLQRYGFDPHITSATYRYLQQEQRVHFPILPSDALDEDLGMDSEDIQQTLRELTAQLCREPHPGLRPTPPITVEDLVRLLQASPRKAQPRSAAA